ncbi:MAG: energy-coupling factor ABC transporter permease [Clostridia bacterium]|nr:energy-coupling factor ABC transporter permease [Clostridia bacterium]
MHLGDNTIPLTQAAVYGVVSGAAVALGIRKYYKETKEKLDYKILCGIFTAFVFTVTIFEIPMPFGSTEHPAGTPLVSIFMGPLITPFISTIVLLLELLFREGAIITLGANVFSLGIVGGTVGWAVFKLSRKFGAGLLFAGFAAGFLGDICVYAATAAQLALGQLQSKSFWFYFLAFVPGQIPLAVVEGIFTGLVLRFIYIRRPEMLREFKVG